MDLHIGNAQFTGDSCNRLCAGLSELHRLALRLLHRGRLGFCMITLSDCIITFHDSMNLYNRSMAGVGTEVTCTNVPTPVLARRRH
jgi:hypothetical protein